MRRRGIAVLVPALLIVLATDALASGGGDPDGERPAGEAHSSDTDKGRRGRERIRLFGAQDPLDAFYITVTGEVYDGATAFPETFVPSPGDRTLFRERLFALDTANPDDPEPIGEQLGMVVAECTQITVGDVASPEPDPADFTWLCSRVFTLEGQGDITVQESYTFADPQADTIAITGGTGDFRDAGGQVNFEVDPIVEGVELFNSVYDVRLLHLR